MEATCVPQEASAELSEETVAVLDFDTRNGVAVIDELEHPVDDLDHISHRVDAVMSVDDAIEASGPGNWLIDPSAVNLHTRVA